MIRDDCFEISRCKNVRLVQWDQSFVGERILRIFVQLVVVDSRLLIYGMLMSMRWFDICVGFSVLGKQCQGQEMSMYKSCWRSLSGRVGITRSFCHHNPVVVQQLADSAVFFSEKGMMCFALLCSKLGFSLEKLNEKFWPFLLILCSSLLKFTRDWDQFALWYYYLLLCFRPIWTSMIKMQPSWQ
jgi:hypothetical protein